jgi:phenylacetic acid degradation operon negative regulatory protein
MNPHALQQARWQERPSARSLLLTLLGELALPLEAPIPSRAFIDGLGLLGIQPGTARQALARSSQAGWIEASRSGRESWWRLSPGMRSILDAGRHRIYEHGRRPPGGKAEWLLLYVEVPQQHLQARRKMATRLAWAGFGTPAPGLWIHPDARRESEALQILRELDLQARAASLRARPGSIGDIAALAARAWDLPAIDQRYRSFLSSLKGQRPRSESRSFVALVSLVHRWRSFPFYDPQLPPDLLPRAWSGGRAASRFHELHERWWPKAWHWWSERST